jgi:hypothetical protein
MKPRSLPSLNQLAQLRILLFNLTTLMLLGWWREGSAGGGELPATQGEDGPDRNIPTAHATPARSRTFPDRNAV